MKKIVCSWVIVVLVLSSMMAIGASAATTPKTSTPKYGGTLTSVTVHTPANLGIPWVPSPMQVAEMMFRSPCVETLLRLDEKGDPVPWLATGWKFSPDLKSLTFTLRQGVKFHDETDFNAKAVKYNLDKYRTSPCAELKVVTSVDIIDDYTVRLNLSEFQAPFLSYFTLNPGEMMSPTSMETHDEAWNLNHPVGTGPFKLVSYQRNVSLKYKKFDSYWQKGKPYLDAYEFVVVSDQTVALMAFKAGQGNALSTNIPTAVELQKEGKYSISSIPVWSYGVAGDSANPDSPFADIRVRRAVSHAIDNAAIAKSLGPGFLRASNQPAAPEGFAYNKAVVGYPYNPQKAKDLLREAGYPNGFKTKVIYQSTHAAAPYFPAIQGYLREVGIDAELQGVQGPLFNQITRSGWKNGLILHLTPARLGYDPTKALMDYLSSKSPSYPSIIRPADYEAKLSKAIIEPDLDKRKVMTREAIKMAVDDHCLVSFILLEPRVHTKHPSLHDIRFCEIWYHLSTPEDAWLGE